MLRIVLLTLTLSGALAACTDTSVVYATPQAAQTDADFVGSIGFTGIGQEPY